MMNLNSSLRHSAPYSAQYGLTLVELMVGLAVGFFVLLAGAGLVATFSGSDRQALLETRLVQDLRATSDVITRDIRRAGYWANASTGVWFAGGPTTPPQNSFTAFYARGDGAPASCDATLRLVSTPTLQGTVGICYYVAQGSAHDTPGASDTFGFKLEGGVISAVYAGGTSTPLTDANTITISDFVISPSSQTVDASAFCSKTCTTNCPTLVVREFEILIKGNIPGNTAISRSLRSNVRVRNDYMSGTCPS